MTIFTSLSKWGKDPLDSVSIKTNKSLYEYKTNGFHVAVRLFSNRSYKWYTWLSPGVFLPYFDVIYDLLLNRHPETWNLCVYYIISSVMLAFWLVFTYDLLEDRGIDDDSARLKFYSCVILWTNHNSSLRKATNQFASFCMDNRLPQSAIFVFVKLAKFEIKRPFFRKF